jgi:phospholipase C
MTDSRRDFLKKAALLTGGVSLWSTLPASIQKAMAISPDPGTTFYDAEHIVLLMQENRSFDHAFGTLRGVRGFNDPRAVTIPGNLPVWFQPDNEGKRYPPFRLDMKDTQATWMGGVPHSWTDQIDARNDGKYDGWIEAKRPGNKDYKHLPLTMGYYTREDIPFYYAFADAFTVCDQHFCASLTGTTTNRSYFWAGKTHGKDGEKAKVRNGELTYDKEADWTTFPERLEEHGISWRVYQNEISLPTEVEDSSLLANFTDNNLEWFSQYGVRFSAAHRAYVLKKEKELAEELEELRAAGNVQAIKAKTNELTEVREYLEKWSPENFEKLSEREKSIHRKAFATNTGDPDYHNVQPLKYTDNGVERETTVPKGDVLYQFRKDVNEDKLPAVSWLVAPQKFSDHPSAPWYGAWYISEVLDILTKNPEVWKKTIFILNYDENDGYFDHIPPFTAPNPHKPESGKVSPGLSTSGEFVTTDEEIKAGFTAKNSRTGPVGLGFRVPLIVASPWTRGGWVNSEVCDITSTIQFMEKFLSHKTGKPVYEPNISSWRRAVSGDLTSVFRPYTGEKTELPTPLDRDEYIKAIYNTSFKELPNNFKVLEKSEAPDKTFLPGQENGTKPSNALNYELYADGQTEGNDFVIRMKAGKQIFGKESLGSPFNVHAPGNYRSDDGQTFESVKTWAFAVKAGDEIAYRWPLTDFEGDTYHLCLYGPNGYFREFKGNKRKNRRVKLAFKPLIQRGKCTGEIEITLSGANEDSTFLFNEENYRNNRKELNLKKTATVIIDTKSSKGWYDFTIRSTDGSFSRHYAGRLETGNPSISDPLMGGL